MSLARAAGMGAICGLRSMAGPAIVCEAANMNVVKLRDTPLRWMATEPAARYSALLALGELVADKLPFTPDRTSAMPLLARAVSGAICGYAVCVDLPKLARTGAAVGALAAIAASVIGVSIRHRAPSTATALLEDAVAFGAGTAIVQSISVQTTSMKTAGAR